MRVSMKENPPTVRCKKSGNAKLYTDSTAINMSYLEDFLTSLAEALAHPPTSTLNKDIYVNDMNVLTCGI
jgi:hypothetical protein